MDERTREHLSSIRPSRGVDWFNIVRLQPETVLRHACNQAYGDAQYVGQESFMTATEILELARLAGVGPRTRLLDLCCGAGAVARHLLANISCRIVGVDCCLPRIRLAAAKSSHEGRTDFLVADATRLPIATSFNVVLLLETMLAIEDKAMLLREVHRILRPSGRFGLTLEEGRSLSRAELRPLQSNDAIWLVTERTFRDLLDVTGFALRHREDHTARQAEVAGRLASAVARNRDRIAAEVGAVVCDAFIAAHQQWADLLARQRVRKLAMVVERRGSVER